jgi:hypothetical protein
MMEACQSMFKSVYSGFANFILGALPCPPQPVSRHAMFSVEKTSNDAQVEELTAKVAALEERYNQLAANFQALAEFVHKAG